MAGSGKVSSPTDLLMNEAKKFARRRLTDGVRSLTDRVGDFGDRLDAAADEGGDAVLGTLKDTAKSMAPGAGGKLGDLASSVTGRLGGGGSDQPKHGTTIIEEINVGVPVRVAYDQWTQFTAFPEFAKGAKRVEQQKDDTLRWEAKVFWSRREWTSQITEQVPDKRIAWTSQGNKGSVDGVVTFHELAPELTKVLLVLEYHPKGVFEHVGNLWRAQGRRARLDLKRFRSYVMQRGEQTGEWRGEIRDGEVTAPEDREDDEPNTQDDDRAQGQDDEAEPDDVQGQDDELDEDDAEPERGRTSRRRSTGDSKEQPARRRRGTGRGDRARDDDAPADDAYPEEPTGDDAPDEAPRRSRRRSEQEGGRRAR